MNPNVFKCPADKSKIDLGNRVRSVSMNQTVGWNVNGNWINAGGGVWQTYKRVENITSLNPVDLFVFLDEHPDGINDGGFAVIGSVAGSIGTGRIIDFPAPYHNQNSSFTFADGHAEFHRWANPNTIPKVQYKSGGLASANVVADPDLTWLQTHASSQ